MDSGHPGNQGLVTGSVSDRGSIACHGSHPATQPWDSDVLSEAVNLDCVGLGYHL